MSELRRATLAEAYGTFLLTLLGPGSIITLHHLTANASNTSILSASTARLGFIGLSFGAAVLAAAYSIGHISGAHINPAVTIAAWATHRIDRKRVLPYVIAQLIGASLASLVTLALWSSTAETYVSARETSLGNTVPTVFGNAAALLAEVLGTAILVFTIFGVTDKRSSPSAAGGAIGLVLAAVIWIFGPISGASLNPARTFGPTLASAGFGLEPFTTLWIYIVGPVLGALLGGFLYETMK